MVVEPVPSPKTDKPKIALILQGGGALGAYHIGAYQALAEHDLHPDWVSGISIGAINSAIIAGNRPEDRVATLDALWEAISWPDFVPGGGLMAPLGIFHNMASNAEALAFGQPNFFAPRPINPYLVPSAPPQNVSFYDTTPMLFTLRRYADFDLINSKITRLSLGATNISTGELEFFDNNVTTITPEHVLASGSLPPGFPATEVGAELYWDGGCVSNTPLEAVIEDPHPGHLVIFMIDLWNAAGKPPTNMNDVAWRSKQIQYASRTSGHIKAAANKVNLRHAMRLLKTAGVAEAAGVPDDPALAGSRLDIVHIIYSPGPDQIPNSDAEFSRSSITERREAGYLDMKAALADEPWHRREMLPHLGVVVHRVEQRKVTTLLEPPHLHPVADRLVPSAVA